MDTSNELFYRIGDQSADGFFRYHPAEKSFNYFNDGLTKICNLTRQQIDNSPELIMEIIHREDVVHAKTCFEECLSNQKPNKYEIRLHINGKEKYVCVSAFPLMVDDKNIICGIVEDITIGRHNKIHIEQINAHKNITLEVLSHDLKEPLGMIRLAASAIEQEIALIGNKALINSLSFIKEMCERNIKLVRSMINREFVKSSVVELNKERTEIVWELEDLLRFYRRSHLREVKKFRFNSANKKIHLMLDTMKFMQVINNLISNAIKFTAINGVIDLEVIDKGNSVLVTVADNGTGIPNELKPKLFEMGTQNLKLGLSGENSGGLGMNIIKTIVELHEGKIWFESEEGKGTKFYIELPKE